MLLAADATMDHAEETDARPLYTVSVQGYVDIVYVLFVTGATMGQAMRQ